MRTNRYWFYGALFGALGLFASCGSGGPPCVASAYLKAGTFESGPGQTLDFPHAGVQKKTLVYDQRNGTVTITYTYNGKTYVETWSRPPIGA